MIFTALLLTLIAQEPIVAKPKPDEKWVKLDEFKSKLVGNLYLEPIRYGGIAVSDDPQKLLKPLEIIFDAHPYNAGTNKGLFVGLQLREPHTGDFKYYSFFYEGVERGGRLPSQVTLKYSGNYWNSKGEVINRLSKEANRVATLYPQLMLTFSDKNTDQKLRPKAFGKLQWRNHRQVEIKKVKDPTTGEIVEQTVVKVVPAAFYNVSLTGMFVGERLPDIGVDLKNPPVESQISETLTIVPKPENPIKQLLNKPVSR